MSRSGAVVELEVEGEEEAETGEEEAETGEEVAGKVEDKVAVAKADGDRGEGEGEGSHSIPSKWPFRSRNVLSNEGEMVLEVN
ncbi:hypothetical protein FIBSPDRAFT_967441 [Athelia psychrophila]|nr:hypothetical protein FIBSPDRAFT_967441 [Fibularhizoctonia sp. CBS 109695]